MCLSDGDQTRSVHNLVVVFGHARGTNWFNPSLDSKGFFLELWLAADDQTEHSKQFGKWIKRSRLALCCLPLCPTKVNADFFCQINVISLAVRHAKKKKTWLETFCATLRPPSSFLRTSSELHLKQNSTCQLIAAVLLSDFWVQDWKKKKKKEQLGKSFFFRVLIWNICEDVGGAMQH